MTKTTAAELRQTLATLSAELNAAMAKAAAANSGNEATRQSINDNAAEIVAYENRRAAAGVRVGAPSVVECKRAGVLALMATTAQQDVNTFTEFATRSATTAALALQALQQAADALAVHEARK
jgi:hypothetical protein